MRISIEFLLQLTEVIFTQVIKIVFVSLWVDLSLINGLLVADGITLTLESIATGEPPIQRGDLGFRHNVCLLT